MPVRSPPDRWAPIAQRAECAAVVDPEQRAPPRRCGSGSDPHRTGGVAQHHRSAAGAGPPRDGAPFARRDGAGGSRHRGDVLPVTVAHGGCPAGHPGRVGHRFQQSQTPVRRHLVRATIGRRPRPARGGDGDRRPGRQGLRSGGSGGRRARGPWSSAVLHAPAVGEDQRTFRAVARSRAAAGDGRDHRPGRVPDDAGLDHGRHLPRVRHLRHHDDRTRPAPHLSAGVGATRAGRRRARVPGDRRTTRSRSVRTRQPSR